MVETFSYFRLRGILTTHFFSFLLLPLYYCSGIQGLYATQSTFITLEIGRCRSSRGRISKRCVTQAVQDDTNERSFIVSADADGEVVTEHCEYVLDQANPQF